MNYRMILRTVGFVLSILAALMLLPLIAGVCYSEGVAHFAVNIIITGALPFVLSGDIPNYLDAVFETVSGFTTTGATILPQVEVLSRGCMFWRMFTQWIGGMSFYDALLHSFAIAGTGGFSTYTLSVGSFGSLYIELVISISLIIFSINFNLHLLIGRVKTVLKSEELRFFLGSIIAATLLVALNLRADFGAAGALRHAFFAPTTWRK